ncbi:MAG TPA: glycosyltransferase N-terminal domain-containing protein [Phycisphaerae bacterium]|nr:glycosyltransferase N-terminal domain-containing protein [Phycisphaerae bacterium]
MGLLIDAAYWSAALVAAPFLALKSARTGKYRSDWPARFGHGPALWPRRSPSDKILLLHCVSVGELLSVRHLIDQLLAADPHLRIAISTTTDTGTARARALFPDSANARIAPVRYPLDFSFAVEAFLDRVRPDFIALVELETWPNFLKIAASRRIPVALINGRITQRSFRRYKLVRPLMASMLRRVSWFGVQTPAIADRFIALGAPPARIEIIPTLKYDVADLADTIPGADALAAAIGLAPDHQLFVAGSTAPGEEAPLLDAYLALREKFPNLRLAIAPRHPETLPPTLEAIRQRRLTPILRTDRPNPLTTDYWPLTTDHVFLLNTLGELKKLYSLAFAAFVGRSLVPLGGSDMIEVAALAKPACFGPHTHNFVEAVDLLLAAHAAVLIHNTADLTAALATWLQNPAAARTMGQSARTAIASQRGSTHRYIQKILNSLASPSHFHHPLGPGDHQSLKYPGDP